jgi:hypothetical protein
MASVVIFGAGNIGSIVAPHLAASGMLDHLVVADVDAQRARAVAMDARFAALNIGRARTTVTGMHVDMNDPQALEQLLEKTAADVYLQCAAQRSWYSIMGSIPRELWARIYGETQFGTWLPVNLALPLKFMQAVRRSGAKGLVLNASYPDVVNAVLARVGLAPACGAGNSEILHTVMRHVALQQFGFDAERLQVRLVAHHYHVADLDNPLMMRERPFWWRVVHDARDVTQDLERAGFLDRVREACPHNRAMSGASSTVKNILRLVGDNDSLTHCSAPAGLRGGRDARITRRGVEVVLHEALDAAGADEIIAAAERAEGIERIDDQGRVTFGESQAGAMRRWFGFDCRVLEPSDGEAQAHELLARVDEFTRNGFRPLGAGERA